MASIPFSHKSVLLLECIESLNIRDGYTYVDCTTGGGGHSYEIAKRLGPNSKLICFDRDVNAIEAAKERLKDYLDKIIFINSNFSELDNIIKQYIFVPANSLTKYKEAPNWKDLKNNIYGI